MSVIFFDLDDTLYDRAVPLTEAMQSFYGGAHNELYRTAAKACTHCSAYLLAEARRGTITPEQEIVLRYQKGLASVGMDIGFADALRLHELYEDAQRHIRLTETMRRCLELCQSKYDRIGVLTNGHAAKQRSKIARLGLEKWVDPALILVSDEVGVLKPDPRIFGAAQQAAGENAQALTMVGDTYENDLRTAIALGWKTIWFNAGTVILAPTEALPTAQVRSEEELKMFFECQSF